MKDKENPLISINEKSIHWHRLIRPVKKKGKHSIVYLCNNLGQLDERVVAKSHGDTYGFRASKKLTWGDQWKYPLRIPNKLRKTAHSSKNIFE